MTSAAKPSSTVSLRYASALIELAESNKALDAVEKDLQELHGMIEGSQDLQQLIRSPLLGQQTQTDALDALAKKAKFNTLTKNFLGVLAQNRRVNIVPDVIKAFGKELSRRRGEVGVEVVTAQDMDAKQAQKLADSIAKSIGAQVSLSMKVDPAIIGGMVVTVGSHMVDDSIARKLARLKTTMTRPANQSEAA